jgi:hypothetical protein
MHLISVFADEYDMDPRDVFSDVEGNGSRILDAMINYFDAKGYNIQTYRLVDNAGNTISYGIDLDDTHPLTIELNLRYNN